MFITDFATNAPMNLIIKYSEVFGDTLQEFVIKIEFGPLEDFIWR